MSTRPLLVRPGARFACFGDGLCCTDVHAFGPISTGEARALRVLSAGSVAYYSALKLTAVKAAPSGGGCWFLRGGLCDVHARSGPMAKPNTCRRFPFGLTATPEGGRIFTDHRCPCRTMGDRPALTPEDALSSLLDRGGRLYADTVVGSRITLAKGKRVGFASYRALEDRMTARLRAGDLEGALGYEGLPKLARGRRWRDLARAFRGEIDGSAGGEALGWFGDSLLTLLGDLGPSMRARPWSPSFDRSEARSTTPSGADDVLADWLLDTLWGIRWVERGSFAHARAELALRLTVARTIVAALRRRQVREDRAAAEALMVVEIAGASTIWHDVSDALRES